MFKPVSPSAALPIAHGVLRILIVLNGIWAAGIVALLTWSLINPRWTMIALGVPSSTDSGSVLMGMRAVAALGLVAILLNHVVLKRLLAMVDTVRAGDPFVAANADRLQVIAWVLVALQLLSITIAAIARVISTPEHPFNLNAGFSVNGWLAVLLTFVLARVFAAGALMRDDLEGTV
jgi:hypothetical protein